MHLDFMVVFSNLFGLFLLIAAGAFGVRMKLIKPEASQHFTALLLKITLPCTIFISLVTREYDPSFLRDSLIMLALSLITYPSLQLISTAVCRLLKIPAGKRGLWTFASTYSNNGFMGYPVCLALFGPEGLALAVIFGIGFNVYVYSIGAMAVASDAGVAADRPSLKKILFTGVNAATLLSLLFYFGQIPLPKVAVMPLTYLQHHDAPLHVYHGHGPGTQQGKFAPL